MKDQAIKMAHRVAKIYGGLPIVNIYEISEVLEENTVLNIRDFGKNTSPEWALFVMNNRNREYKEIKSKENNLDNKYDIVIGPIADDDMAMLFRQYQNEWIDFDMLLQGLTFKSVSNQYSFHSLEALKYLKKVREFNG